MICPYCKEDTINFNKIYLWPFGKKKCPKCSELSKVKKNSSLSIISFSFGMLWIGVPILLDSFWYLIPSTIIIFSLDYVMDKKYRYLVYVTDP